MPDCHQSPGFLDTADGTRLAYHHLPGRSPTVVFLCGFRSDMSGTKALYLQARCAERGQAYLRLDYRGHGQSSGAFEDGSIGTWSEDALAVVQATTAGPVLLVGSSMGGWIMLLVARRLAARVAGLVGIASAPDFTEDLISKRMSAEHHCVLAREGRMEAPSDYSEQPSVITARLLEDGRSHLQLRSDVPLRCPVRLVHGTADRDVPWRQSLALMERLQSTDVRLTLVKDGDHRLSSPGNLALLWDTVDDLLEHPRMG